MGLIYYYSGSETCFAPALEGAKLSNRDHCRHFETPKPRYVVVCGLWSVVCGLWSTDGSCTLIGGGGGGAGAGRLGRWPAQ